MNSKRQSRQRRQRSRDPLDKRVDQWIETGRQFVDGVAGTRPGQRKPLRGDRRSGSSFETVGRWVGDKIDWLREEDDGWSEPWQDESESNMNRKKRPLDAISLRVSAPSEKEDNQTEIDLQKDDWPEEETFKIDRWQRSEPANFGKRKQHKRTQSVPATRRSLPRSSRRRDQ